MLEEEVIHIGILVKKGDTQMILKNLKEHIIKIKNINPVHHINDSDNLVVTIYTKEQKEIFEKVLNESINNEIKEKVKGIEEKKINLGYSNFSYHDIMKKILIKINLEKENYNINNDAKLDILEIPNSFEVIGNIAHLNLREKFLPYKYLIGKIILDKNSSLKTIINKTDKIDNIFRTYSMELLAGDDKYQVVHKEGNINFHFDIRSVYWCSRLSGERDRLLKIIKKGEVLCDAFCGIGPLALRAAKNGVKVYANDLNPNCYEFLKKNILLNKIDKKNLIPFNMDAREFIRMCISKGLNQNESENNEILFEKNEKIDHFYMNLPKDAIEFLDAFRGAFHESEIYNKDKLPIIHVYGFSNSQDPKKDLLDRICKAFNIEKLQDKDFIEMVNIRDVSTKKHMYSVTIKLPFEVAFQ